MTQTMRLVLIADTFPPLRNSGAIQLRDLSREILKQGHDLIVLIPSSDLAQPWQLELIHGVKVLRLRALKTKDIPYIKRTMHEILLPFFMLYNFRKSPYINNNWNGVIWYSPSIFLSPLIYFLKKLNNCKSYLILRDIFPDWAVDMGLMHRGVIYWILRIIANYQYFVADTIGIQSKGNLAYFAHWSKKRRAKLHILQNWLTDTIPSPCTINISTTPLAGRLIFVYAGNMGIAQNVDIFLGLAECLKQRNDIGFLFVGRGSHYQFLLDKANKLKLNNTLFFDEIEPEEIASLYSQCDIGLVSLDSRHKSHNIPGKFISYMQSGIPVLASINPGNDLASLINQENIGRVSECNSVHHLELMALELISMLQTDKLIKNRCKEIYSRLFSPDIAVKKIIGELQS